MQDYLHLSAKDRIFLRVFQQKTSHEFVSETRIVLSRTKDDLYKTIPNNRKLEEFLRSAQPDSG